MVNIESKAESIIRHAGRTLVLHFFVSIWFGFFLKIIRFEISCQMIQLVEDAILKLGNCDISMNHFQMKFNFFSQ